ncbi:MULTISPECIES: bifunctional phosphoribosylaminoimidazolecarboxamide formyltransferase/IMP cyclohydrolase [Aerococcus]|uniref:bifunctional phosphoribosylaminoimidazolecarboxamide formyltransferase/IMP cyclohydrolase n=1 Tax=Aerococcus TaxID=1375 RepID=UPI001248C35C|nr:MULTISPECIES: bifunctional phosphoribosylaminoimidazolecarboxamide formyltransferase/IMP cyclohydrolase [Aerococcus]KAA9292383.1 bifunctional phosphoribosylaminoimidazolecarboxamide formyltransferase/IMP cyclohydrolase [Aerococcus mictus]MDK6448955.1 bifunctional phosphoribosylaminoimidazolecarboxamide formyltransferase/IMP cyclohydrolase [Aerococcus urinae]
MARALISVSNKEGLVELAQAFKEAGIEIISTGGSKKHLEAAGIKVIPVEEVTGFKEMLDGRVKTLHPNIHAGILFQRDHADHVKTMADNHLQAIDYVVVNFYTFKETISQSQVSLAEAVENIDIGGPSMVRAGAKNYQDVTVLTDPKDYASVIDSLKEKQATTLEERQRLAAKAFRLTAAYDALIAQYLTDRFEEEKPERLTLTYELKETLRYGENSQQEAEFYQAPLADDYSISQAKQLNGKALSYNNIKDANAALALIAEFDQPCAVALKHMNPCGVGIGQTIEEAFERCYQADSMSIYGGIVAVNQEISKELAERLHKIFLEIVIAPAFSEEALAVLKTKKNLRLLEVKGFDHKLSPAKEYVSVMGGLLVQDQDIPAYENHEQWQKMGQYDVDPKDLPALELAWKVVKHVKSNAIVVANGHQTLGIGAGQMNRVGSAQLALDEALANPFEVDRDRLVLASDAYLPMADTAELAAQHGIKAIVQPGGSIHDDDSIAVVDQAKIPMLKTGMRHFRH